MLHFLSVRGENTCQIEVCGAGCFQISFWECRTRLVNFGENAAGCDRGVHHISNQLGRLDTQLWFRTSVMICFCEIVRGYQVAVNAALIVAFDKNKLLITMLWQNSEKLNKKILEDTRKKLFANISNKKKKYIWQHSFHCLPLFLATLWFRFWQQPNLLEISDLEKLSDDEFLFKT